MSLQGIISLIIAARFIAHGEPGILHGEECSIITKYFILMTEIILTPEQMAIYKRLVDELENLRTLTDREKERLIRDIMEKPFLDLLCDVAFNFTTPHPGCPEEQLVYEYQHRERVGGGPFTQLHTTYICELPRLAKKALKDMNPVESWFYILRNCRNFAHKPEGMDPRLTT